VKAAARVDAIFNRMYIEPALGLGYPFKDAPDLKQIEKYIQPGDETAMTFDFDFWGLQNYTRIIVKNQPVIPILHAINLSPEKSGNEITTVKFEVYPEAMYQSLKKMAHPVKKIIATENGAAFQDEMVNSEINDTKRLQP
jgi:beta-glucosidase